MKTNQLGILLFGAATLFSAACGRSDSTSPDASKQPDGANGPDAPPGTPDAATSGCANVYTTSSIAAMRQGTVSDSSSARAHRLDRHDAVEGLPEALRAGRGRRRLRRLYAALLTSTAHPCSVATAVAAIATGRSVTVQGTYIKSKTSGYETFYIDTITDNGAGTAPAAAAATIGDISRGGTNKALAFQRVTAPIAANDPLVVDDDWTPAEFVFTGATKCPYQFGFGMIPKSANATATMACTGTTSQPGGQPTPAAGEILIGTDFYKGFTVSSDCQCAASFTDKEPTAASQLKGTISGILVLDVPFGATTPYYYIAPQTNADAPISGTVSVAERRDPGAR